MDQEPQPQQPVVVKDKTETILLRLLEQSTQQTKYLKTVNSAINIIGVLVLLAFLANACSALLGF